MSTADQELVSEVSVVKRNMEPAYRKMIRIHDRIWESTEWSREIREQACQMMANSFGHWRGIEWAERPAPEVQVEPTSGSLF